MDKQDVNFQKSVISKLEIYLMTFPCMKEFEPMEITETDIDNHIIAMFSIFLDHETHGKLPAIVTLFDNFDIMFVSEFGEKILPFWRWGND